MIRIIDPIALEKVKSWPRPSHNTQNFVDHLRLVSDHTIAEITHEKVYAAASSLIHARDSWFQSVRDFLSSPIAYNFTACTLTVPRTAFAKSIPVSVPRLEVLPDTRWLVCQHYQVFEIFFRNQYTIRETLSPTLPLSAANWLLPLICSMVEQPDFEAITRSCKFRGSTHFTRTPI